MKFSDFQILSLIQVSKKNFLENIFQSAITTPFFKVTNTKKITINLKLFFLHKIKKKKYKKKIFWGKILFFLGTSLGNDDVTCKMLSSSKKFVWKLFTTYCCIFVQSCITCTSKLPKIWRGGSLCPPPPPQLLQSPKKPSTNTVKLHTHKYVHLSYIYIHKYVPLNYICKNCPLKLHICKYVPLN